MEMTGAKLEKHTTLLRNSSWLVFLSKGCTVVTLGRGRDKALL